MANGEPRAHHFVPRCWLAGFTDTGTNEGQLFVTDLVRAKQWSSRPANSGHQRDFYRLSTPELDPVIVEKELSKIEGVMAPILKALDQERREPTDDEIESLIWFMAIQWVRVPAFRPMILGVADRFHRSQLSAALGSPESWAAALKQAGLSADSPGADYEGMLEFHRSGEYSLTMETDWYMQRAFNAVETIIPGLKKRHWATSFSPSGSFIGCDNPVILEGPKGQMVGFENAEIVIYPVSRHVVLWGTIEFMPPPFVNRRFIANANTLSLLRADSQVYAHESDFCWLDEARQYQTDWKLFSKEKFQ